MCLQFQLYYGQKHTNNENEAFHPDLGVKLEKQNTLIK